MEKEIGQKNPSPNPSYKFKVSQTKKLKNNDLFYQTLYLFRIFRSRPYFKKK